MQNPGSWRGISFVVVVAVLIVGGCAGLQTGGSSKPASTPAQKTATRPKAPATAPAPAPSVAPAAASASGTYSVTFGINARTSRLGAVQFDARAKSGNWQGAGASVSCRNVSGAAMMACNNKGGGLLSCALIDPNGIVTPKDLVTCRISASKAVSAGDFSVKVTDASSPAMKPVGVSVVVTRVAGN
jgi:hypothetical protein